MAFNKTTYDHRKNNTYTRMQTIEYQSPRFSQMSSN